MKFGAEIIALDGGSDSVYVWMKDKGSAEIWHLGPGRLWMEHDGTLESWINTKSVPSKQKCVSHTYWLKLE